MLALGSVAVERPVRAAAWDKPGWTLTFQDEFDGADVDASKWVKRYKWGEAQINGELEAYVDDAFQVQDGLLSIVGDLRTASYAGRRFVHVRGALLGARQTYGYFEARLRVPAGQGLWPAFWLLGTPTATGVNEIDIHEILGNQPDKVYMTIDWGTDYGAGHMSDGTSWVGPDFSADFHVFGLTWTPDAVVWTIDGVEQKRHTGAGVPQVPMYVILNLAIGGNWPGPPDTTTAFPALYQIDYIRAYSPLPESKGVSDRAAIPGAATERGRRHGRQRRQRRDARLAGRERRWWLRLPPGRRGRRNTRVAVGACGGAARRPFRGAAPARDPAAA